MLNETFSVIFKHRADAEPVHGSTVTGSRKQRALKNLEVLFDVCVRKAEPKEDQHKLLQINHN